MPSQRDSEKTWRTLGNLKDILIMPSQRDLTTVPDVCYSRAFPIYAPTNPSCTATR